MPPILGAASAARPFIAEVGRAMPMPMPMGDGASAMGDGASAMAMGDGAMTGAMAMEGMSPYLFANLKTFFVLFNWARVSSLGELANAMFFAFWFTVITTVISIRGKTYHDPRVVSKNTLFSAASYAVCSLLHYITMLLVMTMNVWLILAVTFGHGVGYLTYAALYGARPSAEKALLPQDYGACESC